MKKPFRIYQKKIDEIVLRAYNAMQNPEEAKRLRRFMPQWNLPADFENEPMTQEPRWLPPAARYLFVEAWFERRTQSREIIAACQEVWNDRSRNWIFEPELVAGATIEEIASVLKYLPHRAHNKDANKAAERFQENAMILIDEYESDPRNIILDQTTEKARDNLQRFWGIGRGIANLYILYCIERQIASPTDPENALLKIDIHKGRIPFNTGAIKTDRKELRIWGMESGLEKAYWKACDKLSLPPEIVDGALWVIGSEICSKKDYNECQLNCPLADICETYTPSEKTTTRFHIYDKNNKRIDTRKNLGQKSLFNWRTWQNLSPRS